MCDDLTMGQRRQDVALEATYQLEALLQAMLGATADTDQGVAMRAFGVRARQLNAFLMSWLDGDIRNNDIGNYEVQVFGDRCGPAPNVASTSVPARHDEVLSEGTEENDHA